MKIPGVNQSELVRKAIASGVLGENPTPVAIQTYIKSNEGVLVDISIINVTKWKLKNPDKVNNSPTDKKRVNKSQLARDAFNEFGLDASPTIVREHLLRVHGVNMTPPAISMVKSDMKKKSKVAPLPTSESRELVVLDKPKATLLKPIHPVKVLEDVQFPGIFIQSVTIENLNVTFDIKEIMERFFRKAA